jgi:hypothetical protein
VNTEVLPSATADTLVQAENRSLYDSLVAAYGNTFIYDTGYPLSATKFVRNLVRAAWEEYILRGEWDLIDNLLIDSDQHRDYHGLSSTQVDEKNNQTATIYQKIISRRRESKEMRMRLEEIRHAFEGPHLPMRSYFDPVRLSLDNLHDRLISRF